MSASYRPRARWGRIIGIPLGTLAILAVGLYGPATLIGPLPAASFEPAAAATSDVAGTPVALPETGSSAVTLAGVDEPIATAGTSDPLPAAGTVKVITALVVLDKHPLGAGEQGATLPIERADFDSYTDYAKNGARTVPVFLGENWTQLEMLQALLLGSSNNHADSLARWAFGSTEEFVTQANAWLREKGMQNTTLADATGLSDQSVATASDLARIAQLADDNEAISAIVSNPSTALASRRGVDNTTAYLADLGVTGLSRSYTDAAGVSFLYAATVSKEGQSLTFYGAYVGQPDYDSLEASVRALMDSAQAGVQIAPPLPAGTVLGTVTSAWGREAEVVAGRLAPRMVWKTDTAKPVVTLDEVRIATKGQRIGTATVTAAGAEREAPALLEASLPDPGPLWRLSHPVPVIAELIASWK